MFTGLIIELGEVVALDRRAQNAALAIRGREILKDISIGDSIAINGVCLTVTTLERDTVTFDVSGETLKSTNLGELKRGDRVNLEPSLRPNSKMGGHFVTGHVDGTGRIRSRKAEGNAERIDIEAPANVLQYLVPKGSVTVDGISLTVVEVRKDSFSLVIIPHTASLTTIGIKKVGDTVNLEPDILAKYVAKFIQKDGPEDASQENSSDERFLSKLKDSGFI
ncbi:MAG TPA: riboflavin synthase [Dissulfurispiraceae bacterium]|nr:riboflavin synthase [Dissulfurispiraceae bacterium]